MRFLCSPKINKTALWLLGAGGLLLLTSLLLSPTPLLAQEEPAAPDATTWYVDDNAGGDGNCTSAGAPCRTIQGAIDRAASGDIIRVAAGTYTFAGANSCTNETGAPSVACVFSKKLALHGGYAAGFGSRNPDQNPSIIDGQGQHRGVFVLSYNNPGATALEMTGFTVRNGLGTGIGKRPGEDAYYGYGGGMFVEYAAAIVLRDMRFENNRAVGGDRGAGAGGVGAGGAISFRNTQSATLSDSVFTGNQAVGGSGGERGGNGQGGAIFTFATNLLGQSLVLDGNLAHAGNSGGDGVTADGEHADAFGGAATFQQGSKITLRSVTARDNQAIGGNAGGTAGGGFGGAFMGEVAEINIQGANIRRNLAQGGNGQTGWFGNGGGLMAIHSTVSINRAVLLSNTAQGGNGSNGEWGLPNGGGIMVTWVNANYSSKLSIANSIIAENKAITGQGREKVIGGGGGLWIQATEALLDHTTIASNELSGGGLFGAGIQVLHTGDRGANVTIRNSLLTGHNDDIGSAVDVLTVSRVTFAGGLFNGNTFNSSADNSIIGSNRGSIGGLETMSNANPQYTNGYHISAQSPARNQVTNATQTVDVDNDARDDGRPDYGADEYDAPARPPLAYYGLVSNRTSVTLRWNVDPQLAGQVTSYRVRYRYVARGGGQVDETVNVGMETSYTVRDLEPYTVVTISVDALNASGGVVADGSNVATMATNIKLYMPRISRR